MSHIESVPAYVGSLYAFRFLNNRIQSLGDILLLDFNPDSDYKRIFDICFSLLVILFTLPLTLLIGLLIKFGVKKNCLFGSYAKGASHDFSGVILNRLCF